ncbi:MAG: peptide chain release factor 2 [Candidatus Omnitrophica bacterium]|nr:peptide chain release factor 2 [Candidatus Omnitrophota bacterium]MDD5351752.1 peptide chain release factor 2 [Candidatus Omnitrophota bacterium]MDD5550963.1 peptide chain release factor 2 [Candidatus Omnitrophota bacterium]
MQEELRDKLTEIEKRLRQLSIYLDIPVKQDKIRQLETIMSNPGFWQDQQTSKKVLRELKSLKSIVELWSGYNKKISEMKELLELIKDEEELLRNMSDELNKLSVNIAELEFQTLLSGEFDHNDAILSINSGAGGTESCDWASMLLRMYTRWAEKHGYEVKEMDILAGEEAGIKNVTISIKGACAYGYLKAESGVHRLVRISPFDANKRRHTSFASVDVIAQIQDDVNILIRPEEIRVDTYRASGKGGQHVNMTDSAVRVTHIETGIVVQCQNERSQYQNKEVCMNVLKAKLYELRRREQEAKVSKEYAQKQKIEWGSQIRSYVMHPYNMVKDHRTEYETGNVQAVMDGDIDDFIHAYLKMKTLEKAKNG